MRRWTTKSAVSRLESGRYARPTLHTVENYGWLSARESRLAYTRAGWAIAPQRGRSRRRMTGSEGPAVKPLLADSGGSFRQRAPIGT